MTIRTVAADIATTFSALQKEPARKNPQSIFNRVIKPFNQRLPLAGCRGGGCSDMYRAIINGLFDMSFGHRCEAGWTDAVSVGYTTKNSRVSHTPACACGATRAVKNSLAKGAGFIHQTLSIKLYLKRQNRTHHHYLSQGNIDDRQGVECPNPQQSVSQPHLAYVQGRQQFDLRFQL